MPLVDVLSREDIALIGQELRALSTHWQQWLEEISKTRRLRLIIEIEAKEEKS